MSTEDEAEPTPPTWPRVVKLKNPITFDDERITQLEFRRGTLGDAKGLKLGNGEVATNDLMLVAARLCGQPMKVIEKLDSEDGGEVIDIALDFYGRFLRTGRTG